VTASYTTSRAQASHPYNVWSQSLEPLGPDACATGDRHAACRYHHVKSRALSGYELAPEDAAWVGVGVGPNPPPGGGWRYPVFGGPADRDEISAEDRATLRSLMAIGDVSASMSRFLGES
jgi:hypothetical protein